MKKIKALISYDNCNGSVKWTIKLTDDNGKDFPLFEYIGDYPSHWSKEFDYQKNFSVRQNLITDTEMNFMIAEARVVLELALITTFINEIRKKETLPMNFEVVI